MAKDKPPAENPADKHENFPDVVQKKLKIRNPQQYGRGSAKGGTGK